MRRKELLIRLNTEENHWLATFEQYVKEGVDELDDAKLPDLLELKYRDIADAKKELGEIKSIRDSFIGFQAHLYRAQAV